MHGQSAMNSPPRMKSMVRWYDPPALAYTASRVIISNIFGEFADPRQAQAASRPFDPNEFDPIYRYAADGDFWFDFVADLGDGWNSTAAIAHALGQDRIEIGGEAYPRGRFLIMGETRSTLRPRATNTGRG